MPSRIIGATLATLNRLLGTSFTSAPGSAGSGTLALGLGDAWTAYTPTVTSSSGAFTTVSAAGRYKQIGKTCFFTVNITITDVGTASGYINLALPNSLSSNTNFYAGGVNGSTGEQLTLKTYGSNTTTLFKYTGAFPGTTGQVLTVSGFIETT